jgi:protein required for attachment to host cells
MMRPEKTWIAVVDGARARFLVSSNQHSEAVTIPGQTFSSKAPPTRELARSKPTRVMESSESARHSIEPRVDLHENQEVEFLKVVIRRLQEAFGMKAFDKFILVAPPKPLGHLRDLMDEGLRRHMLCDIDLDLTKHSDDEIARIVKERLDDGRNSRKLKIA